MVMYDIDAIDTILQQNLPIYAFKCVNIDQNCYMLMKKMLHAIIMFEQCSGVGGF